MRLVPNFNGSPVSLRQPSPIKLSSLTRKLTESTSSATRMQKFSFQTGPAVWPTMSVRALQSKAMPQAGSQARVSSRDAS